MADVIPIDPDEVVRQTLARWKAALPLIHWIVVRSLNDYIEWKRGRRDLKFMVEMNRRAVEWSVVLYDLVANADERKRMRKFLSPDDGAPSRTLSALLLRTA